MRAAVVVPCLNEEAALAETCRSLGFGRSDISTPADTFLLLVDNGSIDLTRKVMEEVAERSPEGTVYIFEELERGFVPPRDRGAREARALCRDHGWAEDDIALIQADADTVYSTGYVDHLRGALAAAGPGILAEADTEPPPDFSHDHFGYVALADAVDASVSGVAVPAQAEIVIDDKAAAMHLGDYFRWGGHQREFTTEGDEIHAETTRLFMRGKAKGARHLQVGGAVADPSRRKLLSDPAFHFATAGFPREAGWASAWKARYHGPDTLEAFEGPSSRPDIADAVWMRQAHSIMLFGVLPRIIERALGGRAMDDCGNHALEAVCSMTQVSADDLGQPGTILLRTLRFIDEHPDAIQAVIDSA